MKRILNPLQFHCISEESTRPLQFYCTVLQERRVDPSTTYLPNPKPAYRINVKPLQIPHDRPLFNRLLLLLFRPLLPLPLPNGRRSLRRLLLPHSRLLKLILPRVHQIGTRLQIDIKRVGLEPLRRASSPGRRRRIVSS